MKNFALILLVFLLASVPAQLRAQYYGWVDPDGGEYTFTIINGGASIVGYGGPPWNVTIPNNFSGLPVTSIGQQGFAGLTSLRSVTIAAGVADIGELAFDYDTNLTSVTIEEGVTSIGGGAFASCYALTNLTLPNTITTIGESAFGECTNLSKVTIQSGVTSLGTFTFEECHALTSIIIPFGVPYIGEGVFEECGLTNVTISASVIYIGEQAFSFCNHMTNIMIPGTVIYLDDQAFYASFFLKGVFFGGNAPQAQPTSFEADTNAVAYYLPGTTGWTQFTATTGVPSVLWNPQIQTGDGYFGMRSNQFGFNVTGTSNIPIVVQASTNLLSGNWSSLTNVNLTNGSFYFSDPQCTNFPGRYYRIAAP